MVIDFVVPQNLAQWQHVEIEQKRSVNRSLGDSACHSHPIRIKQATSALVITAHIRNPHVMIGLEDTNSTPHPEMNMLFYLPHEGLTVLCVQTCK